MMIDSSGFATTGDPPDCEDSGIQYQALVVVDFGEWPPTGSDALGDDAWDVDVQCTYAGVSPVRQGILFDCDDAGTQRQIGFQYSFWPPLSLAMSVVDTVQLRAHTGLGETWTVLSTPAGDILVLAVYGTPEGTLEDQSEYAPFEFLPVTDVCPVEQCERQLGLDVTLGDSTVRIFEGGPLDIVGDDGTSYVIAVEGLLESSDEIDPTCSVSQFIGFAIVAQD